ncbi:hypothetical protein GIB67_038749, partial [Kingdonia uniflora]
FGTHSWIQWPHWFEYRDNKSTSSLHLAAMNELVKMAQTDEPLWIPSLIEGRGTLKLSLDEYRRLFPPCIGMKPSGFVTEATRETVIINILALVEILMDANQWAEMFSCMIARTSTAEVIFGGVSGTKNGVLQLVKVTTTNWINRIVHISGIFSVYFCAS